MAARGTMTMSQDDTPPGSPGGFTKGWLPSTEARDLTGIVLGDYRFERLLGRGGMGEVYLARQLSLDRPIALKVLKTELTSNPTYLARFEKEALSAAKLNHPNIVHIYNFGGTGAIKYIAMEYVEGTNLREFLAKKGPPDLPVALSIMKQTGQAIAAAGESGLVHRDIKPENLLLTRKGQVKVADFGLCRERAQSGEMAITQEGVTVGTPMYMSPEQVRGQELDHRSDLYSLGVTFYHMLAGVPPFRADSAVALALKHIQEQPVHLSVHRPDLPSELADLVMRLMAKAPTDRYQSASEMLRDLSRIRGAVNAPSMGLAAARSDSSATPAPSSKSLATSSATATTAPWRLRERLSQVRFRTREVVAVILLAAGLGALFGARGRADDLLGPRSASPKGPPALWMAPWEAVERQGSAAAQYRHAQFHASEVDPAAAWLAVPGYFPSDESWSGRAYVQLARALFRQGDADRLSALAAALEAAPTKQDGSLARAARAGGAALRDDAEGVLHAYDNTAALDLQPPPLNELGLEVVDRAQRAVGRESSISGRLRNLEERLNEALKIFPWLRADFLGTDRMRPAPPYSMVR